MKNTKYKNILTAATTLLMSVTACHQAISQTLEVPTAGQILKQTLPEEYPLKISENQSTDIPSPSLLKEQPGGMKVQLTSIQFSGNTVYSNSELATVIGDIRGQEFDLGQLRGLANVISEHYRNNLTYASDKLDESNPEIGDNKENITAEISEDPEESSLRDVMEEIHKLIGMENIKEDIYNTRGVMIDSKKEGVWLYFLNKNNIQKIKSYKF